MENFEENVKMKVANLIKCGINKHQAYELGIFRLSGNSIEPTYPMEFPLSTYLE